MELPAVLVLCGLGVAGIAVLLLMGLFSTSGTSYEEAIAQQRRATTELLALAENKSKPKKSTKKASKKLAKKEKNKENAAPATASEPESEAPAESGIDDDVVPAKPHVDFSAPVVVDVPRDTPPNVKVTEKKEEVVEKKEVKPVKAAKSGKAPAKPTPADVKEEVARERHNSGDAPKDQRKAKKAEKKSEEVAEVREEVVPPLNAPQPSELTTDKLLKQALAPAPAPAPAPTPSPPAPKNKKKKPEPNVLALMAGDGGGVNVGELVRVVREAPLSRTEIQILTDALLNKNHDPLPEHSEWTEGPNDPIQKMKKQLADKEKALADEVEASQALHAKLKELRATLNAERGRAAAASRAAEQAGASARAEMHTLQTRLQRVIDENHALMQDKLVTESQLVSQLNALQADLSALQADRNARIMELTQARCELNSVRDSLIMAQQHAAELAQKLQEANRVCAEYAEQIAQQDLKQAQERHNATSELQNEVQRLTTRAQTAENNLEKLKEEAEKQKQKLSSELAALAEQLAARESEMAELKLMKVAPAQNGLPPNNEQHKTAELEKVESLVESLRSELASAQSSSREQKDQLARLQEQLNSYQHKNNEALAKAQEAHYSEVASVLRAACPALAPSRAADREWVRAFADNAARQLAAREQEQARPASPVAPATDLLAQNQHLQGLVDKYKRIIDDTEGVLSRLQQNVTKEEQRWAEQLADKQRELEELRQRTVLQMQKKIDALESELQQAQAANHNHSFADSERQAEERLMGALPSKLSVDVHNGPLQVGLEEK